MNSSIYSLVNLIDMTLPNQRFFIPNEYFFEIMSSYYNQPIFEVGCGTGELSEELSKLGYEITCLDLISRTGAKSNVIKENALVFDGYLEDSVILCCRPDHSGWCSDMLELAMENGFTFIYVGLIKNLEIDLTPEQLNSYTRKQLYVGKDQEILLAWEK